MIPEEIKYKGEDFAGQVASHITEHDYRIHQLEEKVKRLKEIISTILTIPQTKYELIREKLKEELKDV